jgi:hypothetical protein
MCAVVPSQQELIPWSGQFQQKTNFFWSAQVGFSLCSGRLSPFLDWNWRFETLSLPRITRNYHGWPCVMMDFCSAPVPCPYPIASSMLSSPMETGGLHTF